VANQSLMRRQYGFLQPETQVREFWFFYPFLEKSWSEGAEERARNCCLIRTGTIIIGQHVKFPPLRILRMVFDGDNKRGSAGDWARWNSNRRGKHRMASMKVAIWPNGPYVFVFNPGASWMILFRALSSGGCAGECHGDWRLKMCINAT